MQERATGGVGSGGLRRIRCRSCGGELGPSFCDLGVTPPTNAYLPDRSAFESERAYPLHAKVCTACFLVQLDFDVAPEELFSDYAYFSSYSDTWLAHARAYCEMAVDRFGLHKGSFVVELASNDGYLLRNFVERGIRVLGIEPSDTVAAAAERVGVPSAVEFFGSAYAAKLAAEGRSADLVIANNVLAHVPETADFVAGIAAILKPGGSLTIEFPHLLTLMKHVEFDTIYHEHFSYFSLLSAIPLLSATGLQVYDVEMLPTHGGSLRVYARHRSKAPVSESVGRVLAAERAFGFDRLETYTAFAERVARCRLEFREFLAARKAAGDVVVGYGAAAKGTTFLNYCKAGPTDVRMVADRNPHKIGKLLPGCHIPIVSPEDMRAARPDYVLILPWNLKREVRGQLADMAAAGTRFVTAVPSVEELT